MYDWYIKGALETKSPHYDSDSSPVDIVHGVMGLVTESGELLEAYQEKKIDKVNVQEELGDVAWYLAIMMNQLGMKFEDINCFKTAKPRLLFRIIPFIRDRKFELQCIQAMIVLSAQSMDLLKRSFFYGKGKEEYDAKVDKIIMVNMCMIYSWVVSLSGSYKVSINDIMITNLKKLAKRLGKTFDIDKVQNRDLDAEREILEEGLS